MPKTERHFENLRDVLMNVACEFWTLGTQLPQQRYVHLVDLQRRVQVLLHDCELPCQRDDLPSLEEVQVLWPEVVQKVLGLDRATGMLLLESEPVALYLDVLNAAFDFHRAKVREPRRRESIERAIEEVVGCRLAVRCVPTEWLPSTGP